MRLYAGSDLHSSNTCIGIKKEDRTVRDLLQKRMHLVSLRTSLIVSLQNILSRNNGCKLKTSDVEVLTEDRVTPYLAGNEDLALAGMVSKESIDFLTRQIKKIETVMEDKADDGTKLLRCSIRGRLRPMYRKG